MWFFRKELFGFFCFTLHLPYIFAYTVAQSKIINIDANFQMKVSLQQKSYIQRKLPNSPLNSQHKESVMVEA